jgi:cysteine desulfurase family protein
VSPRPSIYLDHAATSWPKPAGVIEAWAEYHRDVAGSPGRGAHHGAVAASRRVEGVRKEISDFLGGGDPSRFLFTPSCTHAMNLAIHGFLGPGDHAVATQLDHNAALRPLADLANKTIIGFTIAKADASGCVTAAALRAAMAPSTKLVVCTHASNALGTVQDVAMFVEVAKSAGARVLLDAAQTAGAVAIDARAMGVDFIAIPGHKGLLGPSGIGGLWVAPGIELRPDRFGGTGLSSSDLTPPVTWPTSFEAGTGNPAGIVAFGAGLAAVAEEGPAAILTKERALLRELEEGLARIPRVTTYGSRDVERRVGVCSLTIDGYDPNEVAAILDASFGIQTRAGQLCAPLVPRAVGAPEAGFVRVSLGRTTTREDVAACVRAIEEIAAS